MSQKQEINRFSEESQKLLVDMNHTEIFELCQNSAKLQRPDCNAFSDIGIIFLQLREKLEVQRSPTTTPEGLLRLYFNPWLVIKKNSSRGPKHGASEKTDHFFQGEGDALKRARQPKHGSHPTILARWYAQERYRDSLAKHIIGEKEVMLFDRIARERLDCTASRAERLQNAKHYSCV